MTPRGRPGAPSTPDPRVVVQVPPPPRFSVATAATHAGAPSFAAGVRGAQAIGTVSRQVGHRLGRHLDKIVPLLLRAMGAAADESRGGDAGNDLRENCLHAFESFVTRCPAEVWGSHFASGWV